MLILGIASLLVPVPNNVHTGLQAGGVSIGVETQHDEKVPPIVSAIMILGGTGLLIAAKRKG